MAERREYPRMGISFPVECASLPQRKYFYTVSKNLSLGGVKIISYKFIPKEKLLKLDLNFIDQVLKLKVKVAWCNQERAAGRYLVGLEFVEADEMTKNSISEFLNTIST